MGALTKKARIELGDGKLIKAKALHIKIIKTSKNYVELQVLIENKWGEFLYFPNSYTNPLLSEGMAVTMICDDNFIIKQRLEIT